MSNTHYNKMRDELAKKNASPYHETSQAREVAFKSGWDECMKIMNEVAKINFEAGRMCERILINNPNNQP